MAFLPNPAVNPAAPVRRLRELLDEQQEPFLLDDYLQERGCSKKWCTSLTMKGCGLGSIVKNNEGFPKCSKLIKSVLSKILSGKNLEMLNCDGGSCNEGTYSYSCIDSDMGKETHVGELDGSSSASSTTVSDSSSEENLEESPSAPHILNCSIDSSTDLRLNNMKEQVSADRRIQCMEETKQFSAVSGHNQTVQSFSWARRENPSSSSLNQPDEVSNDSIISGSIWEILEHHEQEFYLGCSSTQYLKSKWVMQQKKKVLLDCVREVFESYEGKDVVMLLNL